MAGSAVAKESAKPSAANKELVSATAEIVTQAARTAAGELVKGQQTLRDVARVVASDTVDEIEKRGPELAKKAGIMTWRYAALGWVTWNVGKRIVRRKAKNVLKTRTKGEKDDG
jgi:hypothetical protein